MNELKASDHPYYSSESNFYSNDPGGHFDSWAEFLSEWEALDLDMNLLIRWDWLTPEPDNYLHPGDEDYETSPEERMPDHDTLWLYYVLQRKGIYLANDIKVTDADEPSIRAFLEVRFDHLKKNWTPLGANEAAS